MQETGGLATYFFGNQFPDPQHLIAMVRVGYEIAITAQMIEQGKTVRGKGTDAPRRFLFVEG